MTDTALLNKSVTRADHDQPWRAGQVIWPIWSGQQTPGLPRYWTPARDWTLSATLQLENLWAAAIFKAITKLASKGWIVEDGDDSQRRTERAQELLLNASGPSGWVGFLTMHLQDYLLTDNGAPVEVVRASSAAGSRILGLMPLDSLRCTRTGDSAVPFLYRDLAGAEHELRDYQVLDFVDMRSPRADLYGVGMSAASRAWRKIHMLSSMEVYLDEKISGARPNSIYIVNGMAGTQLEDAVTTAKSAQEAKGYIQFRGAIIVTATKPDADLNVIEIPLAQVPDGFNAREEREEARLVYAHSIGIDLQELQPQPAGLNSGGTALVLAEKAKGQGLAAWAKQAEHFFSHRVLPKSTTFAWSERDLGEQEKEAQVQKLRADRVIALTTPAAEGAPALLSREQGLQILVDAGDIPKEFIPKDQTAGGILEDDEKLPTEQAELPTGAPAAPAPTAGPLSRRILEKLMTTKAAVDLPPPLRTQLDALRKRLAAIPAPTTGAVDDWLQAMQQALGDGFRAAAEAGYGAALPTAARDALGPLLKDQLELLGRFAGEISEGGWQPGMERRQQQYAESAGAAYWAGATKFLPLPALPRDGTCITTPESRVTTRRGLVPISQVCIGDLVLTHKHRWRPVTAVFRHKAHQRGGAVVQGKTGTPVGFTDDHRLLSPSGWQEIYDIDTFGLSVYNIPITVNGDGNEDNLPTVWRQKGFTGGALSALFVLRQGESAMEEPQRARQDDRAYQSGDDGKADAIYRLTRWFALATQIGRARLYLLLGRRHAARDLPLSMAMDHNEWADSRGTRYSPHRRGPHKRCADQSGVPTRGGALAFACAGAVRAVATGAGVAAASAGGNVRAMREALQNPHKQKGESVLLAGLLSYINAAWQGARVDMRGLREDIPCAAGAWARPQVLLTGMLEDNTILYDIEVAEDHSFVVEGIVAHNSQCMQGCTCAWDVTELEGDGNYDCTWVMGAAEHCQTCVERAQQWAPLQIRDGEIV